LGYIAAVFTDCWKIAVLPLILIITPSPHLKGEKVYSCHRVNGSLK
jgi:hypothetical protein